MVVLVGGLVTAVVLSTSKESFNLRPKASSDPLRDGQCRDTCARLGTKEQCDRTVGAWGAPCEWVDLDKKSVCRNTRDCSSLEGDGCRGAPLCQWVPEEVACTCKNGESAGDKGPAKCKGKMSGNEWDVSARSGCAAKPGGGPSPRAGGNCQNDDDCTKKNGADWRCDNKKCVKRPAQCGTVCFEPGIGPFDDPNTDADEIGQNCRDAGLTCAPPQGDGKRFCWGQGC